ncbi:hypothetical protein UlMin_015024 [Ulmus minor]
MANHQTLLQPLLPPFSATQTTNTNSGIIVRLLFFVFVATLSLWASLESSKGFEISIVNQVGDSPAGKRFALFYISNDKATRILLNTSNFVQNLLYNPNTTNTQKIKRVTLRLAACDSTNSVTVHLSSKEECSFIIDLSPQIMEASDVNNAVELAILRGMARVWLWDVGELRAPPEVLAGLVEYVVMAGGFCERVVKLPECDRRRAWHEEKDARVVGGLLSYCEEISEGFIQRLIGAIKDGWHDRMVDDALGIPAQHLCGPHKLSNINS